MLASWLSEGGLSFRDGTPFRGAKGDIGAARELPLERHNIIN
jgi:hypothetical protein